MTNGTRLSGSAIGVPVALALGIVLRTWQWAARPSLWFDELAIALNVRDRGVSELVLQPLDHAQIAPAGFLFAVDAVTTLFGTGERALRLVPWLMAVLSLVLVWRVARRFVSGVALVVLVLAFGVSPALTWYGGNVKQYSGDVAFSLLLVLLALRYVERPDDRGRVIWSAGLGVLALLSSQPAVMTAAVLATLLVLWWGRAEPRPGFTPLAIVVASWSGAALLGAWAALRFSSAETREYMTGFWAEGFAPFGDGVLAVLVWVPKQLFHVLAHSLVMLDEEAWPLAVVPAAFAAPGLLVLVRRHVWRGALVLAPVAASLLGGFLHVLPMRNRVAVYAGWPLLVAAAATIDWLNARRSTGRRWLGRGAAVLATLPLVLASLFVARPPYRVQEMRPLLEELVEKRQPGDVVYVYCKAGRAASFYGPSLGLGDYRQGGCYDDAEGYIREVESLRGESRVWFVFTQWTPDQPFPDAIKAHLAMMGREIGGIPDFTGSRGQQEAAAHLYEMERER